jgi:pimeloyl-ACP methyl ester carboxylesterase
MIRRKTIWRLVVVVAFLTAVAASVVYTRPLWLLRQFLALRLCIEGAESREVNIGGRRIHYYVRGPESGQPIVLVHGLGGRAEDWINLAPYLVRAGYRVYTPDLLGFGHSEQPADATYSIHDQSELIIGFFDAMQLKQPDLVGWSMGGWIVQRAAIDHPQRIRRLVLVDSAGLLMPPDWDTRLFTPTTAAQLDQLDALLMPNPPNVPAFLADDIVRNSQENGWVVKRALASMLTAKDVTDFKLPSLQMPVLILWGDLDHITPLSEGREMHKLIPQSRLAIAPNCGHLAPEQCSALYGPELVRFLQADPPLPAGDQILHGTV